MAEEKAKNKIPVFQFLMGKHGRDKVEKNIRDAAANKGVATEFWKSPAVGQKKKIKFLKAPEATVSEAFVKSGGVGFVGTIEDLDELQKYPIGLTEPQIFDIAGEVQAHFPDWSVELDPAFGFIENLSFEAEGSGWKDKHTGEERKKIRFTIEIDTIYNKKKLDIKDMVKQYIGAIQGGTTIDMFGTAEIATIPVEQLPQQVPVQ